MRAVERDRGHHAAWARLRFQLLGASDGATTLGSGRVRQQIGLKLLAANPCNLAYVMWRSFPDSAIAIYVKRNAGETRSSQCGNGGYTDVATIPAPAVDAGVNHVLEVHTRHLADGSAIAAIYVDGRLLRRQTLPATLAAGLNGPIGVRSDNGAYLFHLAARNRG
jgi:hypothetical protein